MALAGMAALLNAGSGRFWVKGPGKNGAICSQKRPQLASEPNTVRSIEKPDRVPSRFPARQIGLAPPRFLGMAAITDSRRRSAVLGPFLTHGRVTGQRLASDAGVTPHHPC